METASSGEWVSPGESKNFIVRVRTLLSLSKLYCSCQNFADGSDVEHSSNCAIATSL